MQLASARRANSIANDHVEPSVDTPCWMFTRMRLHHLAALIAIAPVQPPSTNTTEHCRTCAILAIRHIRYNAKGTRNCFLMPSLACRTMLVALILQTVAANLQTVATNLQTDI